MFSGDVAFGIAKGINRDAGGPCLFYYYMSTDYLPPPWRLLVAGAYSAAIRSPRFWFEPGTGSAGIVADLHDPVLLVDVDHARLQRPRLGVVEHARSS